MILNISTKDGKSYRVEVQKPEVLYGKKIGESFSGNIIGLTGYEFLITGGSDLSGFPMKREIQGNRKLRIMTKKSVGARLKKGEMKRKVFRGNTINADIVQVNVVVTKNGNEELEKFAKKAEKKAK
ncbi:MAG: S6e family ribosomal protein [Candidatus Anstonellales archaeon]